MDIFVVGFGQCTRYRLIRLVCGLRRGCGWGLGAGGRGAAGRAGCDTYMPGPP